jgi:hypothetical protein
VGVGICGHFCLSPVRLYQLQSIIFASVSDLSGRTFVDCEIHKVSAVSVEERNVAFETVEIVSLVLMRSHWFHISFFHRAQFRATMLKSVPCFPASTTVFLIQLLNSGRNCHAIILCIVVPAYVVTISIAAFAGCNLPNTPRSHFGVVGRFVLDFSGKTLIRYFGSDI